MNHFEHLERLGLVSIRHEDSDLRNGFQTAILLMNELLDGNTHLCFVKKVKQQQLDDDDAAMLLLFFHHAVNNDDLTMTLNELSALYDDDFNFSFIKRQLKSGSHALIRKELIESVSEDGFANCNTFRLTEKAREEFLEEIDEVFRDAPVKGLKRADSIHEKTLYYPEKTRGAIDEIIRLLREENFRSIQKRLGETGMRGVFACLFSGGQIENIARKSTVHRVLSGGAPAWPGLVRFCEDETVRKESGRTIGFAVPA